MAQVTIVASRLTTTGLRPAYGSLLFEPYPVPLNLPDGVLSPGGVRVFLDDELGDTVADLEPLGNGRAYRVTVSIGGVDYVEYVPVVGDAAYHELPRVDEATLTTVTDAPPAWTVALDTETTARTAADTTEAAARAAADTAEAQARAAADTTEAAARAAADTTEATTRAAADTALSNRLTPLEVTTPTAPARAILTNTVVLFGTSLEAQNGLGSTELNSSSNTFSSRGWANWAQMFLGDRFRIVRNAGVGGNTYTQMRARLAADVLAYPSDWVFMGGPVNDVAGGTATAAQIIADATAMLDAIHAAGRRVCILTATPSAFYDTTAKRAVLTEVNKWIRNLPITRAGVVVVDAWATIADLTTGSPATGMVIDGVHYSEMGAQRIGREAAVTLADVMPPRPHRVTGLLDSDQLIGNPGFTGSGSGWTVLNGGATVAYTPDPDRFGVNIATLTLSGITDTAERAVSYLENITTGRYAPGDVVQLTARIRWNNLVPVTSAAGPCRPFLRILPRKPDGTQMSPALSIAAASSQAQIPVGFPPTGEVIASTHPLTLPAGIDRVYVAVGWVGAASGVLQISDVAAVKGA